MNDMTWKPQETPPPTGSVTAHPDESPFDTPRRLYDRIAAALVEVVDWFGIWGGCLRR